MSSQKKTGIKTYENDKTIYIKVLDIESVCGKGTETMITLPKKGNE